MQIRKFCVKSRYLLLPLANVSGWFMPQNQMQTLSIYANDCLLEELELCLSAAPRCWSPLDLDRYAGMELTLCLENGDEALMDLLACVDALEEDTLAQKAIRPLVHITPLRGFMNDPNGLFYYKDQYHYFAQLNPYGFTPGNTCWMHAVSPDLMHWRQLPHAILPDESGRMYSGCGVVDVYNTSGMGKADKPAIFLFYTAAGSKTRWSQGKPFEVCAAVSLDDGASFEKLSQNPLVRHISFMNRDPKVVFCSEENAWIMMLYLDNSRYQLLFSIDLLHWRTTQIVDIPGSAECPDLFSLPLDGDESRRKWILWGSTDNYLVGQFRGGLFIQEGDRVNGPTRQVVSAYSDTARGAGSYAAQTYFGLPNGRVVQQAWIQTRLQTAPFVSCASIPNELTLVSTGAGPRLSAQPVREVDAMAVSSFGFRNRGLEELERIPREAFSECMDIAVLLRYTQDHPIALSVRGVLIVYDPRRDMLMLPNGMYQLHTKPGALGLRILTDRCSLELYTLDGLFNITLATVLDPAITEIKAISIEASIGIDIEIKKLQ